MIELTDVLAIHQRLLDEFGGAAGVRNMDGLKSALERPSSGFGNSEFYPEPEQKAAAILESIVSNHSFIDGNKRTGYVLMRLLLLENGRDVQASQDEKYTFVIDVTTGKLRFDQIVDWINAHRVDSR